MKFLSAGEICVWCEANGLKVTSDGFLYYDTPNLYCFSVGLEVKPPRAIALADYLVPTWKDFSFEGALLWIREPGISGDYADKTGAMILQQMRLGKGESELLEKRPGHLFSAEELFEMHSYFVIPMLFGWDAFLIPERKDYFIFVSHDGVVGVISRTPQTSEALYERVFDWHPQQDKGWYRRFAE